MDESIGVSLTRVENCIRALERDEFTTADVIREYRGRFGSDLGTDAYYSFNAQFGKLLKDNETCLGIVQIASNTETKDDHGRRTHVSKWRLVNT